RPDHFHMQVIGGRDIDDLHIGMCDHLFPVCGPVFKVQSFFGFSSPRFDVVSTDHQPCTKAALMEPVVDHSIVATVNQSHQTNADDTNSKSLCDDQIPSTDESIYH